MKCCVSTDVGTWTNWLTFEPDPDCSPDARTGLLSPLSYKGWYTEFYVGKHPTYTYWPLQRRVILQWFYPPSRRNIFVRGACAPPSALLVEIWNMKISSLKDEAASRPHHTCRAADRDGPRRLNWGMGHSSSYKMLWCTLTAAQNSTK